LEARKTQWDVLYPKASNKGTRSSADVLAREECQAAYTEEIRTFVNQQLRFNPRVSNPDKERLGLNVPSGDRHEAPAPTTAPVVLKIDTTESRRHTIHFVDEGGERAKPEGVHGCEIYMKKGGDPPVDDSEFTFFGTDTKTPAVIDFDMADIGKTVYYQLRWVNTVSVRGPWSQEVSAVVT
jgi:hypothetical protein